MTSLNAKPNVLYIHSHDTGRYIQQYGHAARTKRWKCIRRFDGRQTSILANCDDSESKSAWIEQGWRERPIPLEELCDLCFDPNEMGNVADAVGKQQVLEEMRSRVDRWMMETNDPLLHGPVAAPAGVKVNDANNMSPRWRHS